MEQKKKVPEPGTRVRFKYEDDNGKSHVHTDIVVERKDYTTATWFCTKRSHHGAWCFHIDDIVEIG